MHMASLKKNFLYNISITLANYIAALIVFPYVSRCLGVELMGKTSFATNVVAYFSLFAFPNQRIANLYLYESKRYYSFNDMEVFY